MSSTQPNAREQLRLDNQRTHSRARRRKMALVGAGVVGTVAVASAIAVAFGQSMPSAAQQSVPHAVVNQLGVQAGTNPDKTPDGIAVHPDKAKPNAPVVQLFADYQCPSCKQFDKIFGAELNAMAESGDIAYSVQIETFLDRLGANKSTDPAIAAACSDIVGVFPAYHLALYEAQPDREGQGFTRDQLRQSIPARVGVAGDSLKTFQQCFDARATAGFVSKQNQYNSGYTGKMYQDLTAAKSPDAQAWGSTPMLSVNGKRLDFGKLDPSKPESIREEIAKLAG